MLTAMTETNPYADVLELTHPPTQTPARRQIERALVDWMHDTGKGAAEVTVCALAKRAFVARSTFYKNYAHADAVLDVIEQRILAELCDAGDAMRALARGGASATESYDAFVRVLHRHEDEFRLLLVELPSARFVDRWKRMLGYHFWERLFTDGAREQRLRPSTVNRALVLEMIASAFISGVRFWLMTPERVEIPEIKALILRLIRDIDEVW